MSAQGFQTRIAEVVTTDFRNFKLVTPIKLIGPDGELYQLPVGAPSDLASSPRAVWDIIPPFGEYALEAYAHDCFYQNTALKFVNGTWLKAALTKEQCDDFFNWLMQLNPKISELERETLYHAVVECGGHAFKEDRS